MTISSFFDHPVSYWQGCDSDHGAAGVGQCASETALPDRDHGYRFSLLLKRAVQLYVHHEAEEQSILFSCKCIASGAMESRQPSCCRRAGGFFCRRRMFAGVVFLGVVAFEARSALQGGEFVLLNPAAVAPVAQDASAAAGSSTAAVRDAGHDDDSEGHLFERSPREEPPAEGRLRGGELKGRSAQGTVASRSSLTSIDAIKAVLAGDAHANSKGKGNKGQRLSVRKMLGGNGGAHKQNGNNERARAATQAPPPPLPPPFKWAADGPDAMPAACVTGKPHPVHGLPPQWVCEYYRDGFAGPFTALAAEESHALADVIRKIPAWVYRLNWAHARNSRFVYYPVIAALAKEPSLLQIVQPLLGPNVALYGVSVATRAAGVTHRMHVDMDLLQPCNETVAVWMAVTGAGVGSNLHVLRSSHRAPITAQEFFQKRRPGAGAQGTEEQSPAPNPGGDAAGVAGAPAALPSKAQPSSLGSDLYGYLSDAASASLYIRSVVGGHLAGDLVEVATTDGQFVVFHPRYADWTLVWGATTTDTPSASPLHRTRTCCLMRSSSLSPIDNPHYA